MSKAREVSRSRGMKIVPTILILVALCHQFLIPCSFASQKHSLFDESTQTHNWHGCFLYQKNSMKKLTSVTDESSKKIEEINRFFYHIYTLATRISPTLDSEIVFANFLQEMTSFIRIHFLFTQVRTTVLLT